MRYRLCDHVSFWAGQDRLRVESPRGAFEFEGESALFLERLLNALAGPTAVAELTQQLGVSTEEVEDALSTLEALQVATTTEESFEPRSLLDLARRLETLRSEFPGNHPDSFCVAVSFDAPASRKAHEDARESGRTLLSIVLDGPEVWVLGWGPKGNLCVECLRLRREAHGSREAFQLRQGLRAWATQWGSSDFFHPEAQDFVVQQVRTFLAGRDTEGRFRLSDEPCWVSRRERPQGTVHRLFPHSHCRVCAPTGPSGVMARLDAEQPVASESLLSQYRDERLGLFSYAEDWNKASSYFNQLPVCWGGFHLIRGGDFASTGNHGYMGVGETLEQVRRVGASEGFERYGLSNVPPTLRDVPFSRLREKAVDPRTFALYEEAQYQEPGFPRPRFDVETPLHWVEAESLSTGKRKWVPYEFVVSALPDDDYRQRLIDQYFSTGGASHVSYARAAINGLREVIERDAFMIAWYKKVALPQVRLPPSLGDSYADALRGFLADRHLSITVLDLRLDFQVPAFLTLATSNVTQGCWPEGGVVLSATCDLQPLSALTRGLREIALHYETLVVNPTPERDPHLVSFDENSPSEGWRDWIPNYLQYLKPEMAARTAFLLSKEEVAFEALPGFAGGEARAGLATLLRALSGSGLEAYACDLVTPDIEPSGFRVLKVLVPGMVDLTPARQSRRLASPRVEEVARKTGRSQLPPGILNPHSHPNA